MAGELGIPEVERAVVRAVERLLDEDIDLLHADANERALTHRLAVHLEREFHGWHVDCEYNRQGLAPKSVVLERGAQILDSGADRASVVPDIVVHRRGTSRNLVVIEAKKTSGKRDHAADKRKLAAYREQLDYRVAVFVLLSTGTGRAGAIIDFGRCPAVELCRS